MLNLKLKTKKKAEFWHQQNSGWLHYCTFFNQWNNMLGEALPKWWSAKSNGGKNKPACRDFELKNPLTAHTSFKRETSQACGVCLLWHHLRCEAWPSVSKITSHMSWIQGGRFFLYHRPIREGIMPMGCQSWLGF